MKNFKISNTYSLDSYTMYDYEFNAENNTIQTGSIIIPNDKEGKKFYVMYLLHGMGSNREWQNHNILSIMEEDAQRNGKQYIIILPNVMETGREDFDTKMMYFKNFYRVLMDVLIPCFERSNDITSNFTYGDWSHRIIAGISLGAMTSLYCACKVYCDSNKTDAFSFVAAYAPSEFLANGILKTVDKGWFSSKIYVVTGNQSNNRTWLSCGLGDSLKYYTMAYFDLLNAHGTIVNYNWSENGHDWNSFPKQHRMFLDYLAKNI